MAREATWDGRNDAIYLLLTDKSAVEYDPGRECEVIGTEANWGRVMGRYKEALDEPGKRAVYLYRWTLFGGMQLVHADAKYHDSAWYTSWTGQGCHRHAAALLTTLHAYLTPVVAAVEDSARELDDDGRPLPPVPPKHDTQVSAA